MKPVVLTPFAQLELDAAASWYAAQEAGLGEQFVYEIDRALARLGEGAHRKPVWRAERPYRKALVHRFPYVVFFVDDDHEIRVLAIAHQKRKPGYWLGREP